MHTVYHLPEFVWPDGRIGKIGCTKEYPKRCLDQGHTNYEALFTHEDGWIAGDKELELQAEYGYRVDTCHYMVSLQNRHKLTREQRLKGSSISGRLAKESGRFRDVQRLGGLAVGSNLGKAGRVLTYEQAQEIKTKYIPYKYTMKTLAKEYNVTSKVIKDIVNNKTYLEP